MRKLKNGSFAYSPSDLTTFLESPFSSWMDRFALEYPGEVKSDPEDESEALVQEKGMDHERKVLAELHKEFGEVVEIPAAGDFAARNAATLEAMKAGPAVIYQAALQKDPFNGYADFLTRVPGKSLLGDYSYEPWDSKLARSAKPYFVIQLLMYAEMLEKVQGVLPTQIVIVLGTGERKSLRLRDFYEYYRSIKQRFLAFQHEFDVKKKPMPQKNEAIRNWANHAGEMILQADDLSQVAGIRSPQMKKLSLAGIKTMTALAQSTLPKIPDLGQATYEKLKRQARLQVESKGCAIPKHELLDHPVGERRGLRALPPPSAEDVFFDMEGYPLMEDGSLEYLFGAIYLEPVSKKEIFIDFWAHSRPAEKKAFEAWIDWVFARFKRDPSMHIYHYAAYEVTAMRRLATQYATREHEVDTLLRGEVFVDLFKVVAQGLVVGEDSYSIKSIEHLYEVKRDGGVTNAGDSIVEYARYLEQPDGADWQTSKILKRIRDYNEVDCISTRKLADWLWAAQKTHEIDYLKQTREMEDESEPNEVTPAARLAATLLKDVQDKPELTQTEKIQKVLAELLEFHRREGKQYWWKYFDWLASSHEELLEDSECVGSIERTATPPIPDKRSQIAEYRFDPSQEVKFRPDSDCKLFVSPDQVFAAKIVELDTHEGRLTLRLGPKPIQALGGFPAKASLLPPQPINTAPLSEAILEIVTEFSKSRQLQSLPPALANLLTRSVPTLTGSPAAIDVASISRLNGGAICVQGPPGAGKTYTGSRVILSLLKSGKKVGVASNSHHAIENLLLEVASTAKAESFPIQGYKAGGDSADFIAKTGFRELQSKDVGNLTPAENGHLLVGGTAWLFSKQEAVDQLDYLFIDEAGQVALANLVAMSRSAKNLVLMGDQRQLEQPTQGSHPGESGESCLTYLLQDLATIPPELGIFLDNTYRMRPEICDFVSKSFYESRLKSHPMTSQNQLELCSSLNGRVLDCGVAFVEVPHEDCSQSSMEEVEAIQGLIKSLLASQVSEKGTLRKLTAKDILVVAPYNLQVGLLKDHLPQDIAVGSVDKFQGKEAHVVILSMCSSNLEASPRGVEFLFNPNRLNVALSRAKCLAIVVGNPDLKLTDATSIEKMKLVNLFCALTAGASGIPE